MARCTNCSEVLPFMKVAFLSGKKNTVECPKCHIVLEGEQKQLRTIGAISGGVGGTLGFLTVYSFFHNSGLALIFLLIGISVMLAGAMIQNQIIKLKSRDLNALQQ